MEKVLYIEGDYKFLYPCIKAVLDGLPESHMIEKALNRDFAPLCKWEQKKKLEYFQNGGHEWYDYAKVDSYETSTKRIITLDTTEGFDITISKRFSPLEIEPEIVLKIVFDNRKPYEEPIFTTVTYGSGSREGAIFRDSSNKDDVEYVYKSYGDIKYAGKILFFAYLEMKKLRAKKEFGSLDKLAWVMFNDGTKRGFYMSAHNLDLSALEAAYDAVEENIEKEYEGSYIIRLFGKTGMIPDVLEEENLENHTDPYIMTCLNWSSADHGIATWTKEDGWLYEEGD